MKNLVLFFIVFLNFQLISCQKITKKDIHNLSTEESITNNFFKEFNTIYGNNGLLQAGNADLQKGIFEIYLTSKNGEKQWFDALNEKKKYEITIEKLNRSSAYEIAKNFDIWVFYTDKKYVVQLEDESIGNKTPGIVELYYLKAGSDKWEKKKEYLIKNEDEKIKFNDWKQKTLEEIVDKSNKKHITISPKISSKWIGKYNAYFSYGQIGGVNAGWSLKLEISKDTIKANGEGYQISFTDLLIATDNNNQLILNHYKNQSGYSLGEKMNPEIILIEDKGSYFIKTKWIDKDIITKSKKLGYEIFKENP